MASDAVGSERISRVVGYKITKGDFSETSPNLPQRIAILAEANTANQSTLSTSPVQITSAQQAGVLFGYGSPIYSIMRILKPVSGDGVGGIPIWVYPQAAAGGSAGKVLKVTAIGTATANGTHTLSIAGREGVDGVFYDINIVVGDNAATIAAKVQTAVNNVLGSPVIATSDVYSAFLTSKWTGLTSNDLNVTVNTNNTSLGITYSTSLVLAGSGTPSVQTALDSFGNNWNTIVINSYGAVSSIMLALEAFNGIPDPTNPTGRYAGIIMKPFIALTGSVLDDPSSITDARLLDVTITICPAPLSPGFQFEAAANAALLYAPQAQDNPHLDIANKPYPDMPVPISGSIGSMASYDNRDVFVKKGCSTVDFISGVYVVQDFITTYHPIGEIPPQFRYVRNLNIDFNIRFGYYLLEQLFVVDHVIAQDNDTVNADKVVKPKTWTQQVDKYAEDLTIRALTVDKVFMQNSIVVNISTINPDRLETFFRYKRSGFARIASTTAEAGFNFGTLN